MRPFAFRNLLKEGDDMAKDLRQPSTEAVTISRFGGCNFTDLPPAGEWRKMQNLSDRYYPFLSVRRTRERLFRLAKVEDADNVLFKNGRYIYSSGGKIYVSGVSQALVNAGSGAYRFTEIGNRVLCLHQNPYQNGFLECSGSGANARFQFTPFLYYRVASGAARCFPAQTAAMKVACIHLSGRRRALPPWLPAVRMHALLRS